jgi:hypothetical protein
MDEVYRQTVSMWAEIVTGGATVVLAGTAILGLVLGLRQLRLQARIAQREAGLSTLWHLEEKWMSPEMISRRQGAAESIRAVRTGQEKEFSLYVDIVLDFFDLIGLLLKTVPLDEEVAWHRFYYPVVNYWFLTRRYVDGQRKHHPQVWEDLVRLVESVMSTEARKKGCSIPELAPSEPELDEFLEGEAKFS